LDKFKDAYKNFIDGVERADAEIFETQERMRKDRESFELVLAESMEAKRKLDEAQIRTASATENTVLMLNALSGKVDKLSDALETERQIRHKADEKQERETKNLKTIAIVTLIANWFAVIIALVAFFRK